MMEMTFSGLRSCQAERQPVMMLREKGGDAYLPIVIGPYEGQAISLGWQKVQTPRPMSHDLMRDLLSQLGAELDSIYINDFKEGIFYARLIMDVNGRHAEIDCRPSDAVALAVRTTTRILVEEWIVQSAGFTSEEPAVEKNLDRICEEDRLDKAVREKETEVVEDLSAFRDFINTLDLDDLDPKRQ